MIYSVLRYLVESSICLMLFVAVYRLLISDLTHFSWMRIYLLAGVILSMILPVAIIPIEWNSSFQSPAVLANLNFLSSDNPAGIQAAASYYDSAGERSGISGPLAIIYSLVTLYCMGLLYRATILVRSLISINNCIRQSPKRREGRYWLINLKSQMPPFSFFNYIFLTTDFKSLPAKDQQRILDHEKIHARQLHSLDILFIELVSVFFWFNPFMKYLKKSVQEVHEYTVDEKIAGSGDRRKEYAQLLLTLASELRGFNLSAGFTGQEIKRRIGMIIKPRSVPRQKLAFIVIIPVTLLLLLSFSYIKDASRKSGEVRGNEFVSSVQQKIGNILWIGNNAYSSEKLNSVLGLKRGDVYSSEDVRRRLMLDNISELYLDNGFVFFRADFTEAQKNGSVDLTITIYEGKKAKIGEVIIRGNVAVPSADIRRVIPIKTGDLFSKSKIKDAVMAIAGTGKFDPEKINPRPVPNTGKSSDEFAVIDLIFELTEIVKK